MAAEAGVERGVVVGVPGPGKALVEVPALGRGVQFGPLDVLGGVEAVVGARCIVATVHGSPDDLVVLGFLR